LLDPPPQVSPQSTNRMVDGGRGVLNALLADVFIFTDAVSGREAGASPGYGLTLVAETTSGCLISAECCAAHGAQQRADSGGDWSGGMPAVVPEDVGRACAQLLLEEVQRGGVVDGGHQPLLLTMCALGAAEINQVRLGPLTPQAVRTLRHIKDFFDVQFSIKAERESRTLFLSCIGTGLRNLNKKVT
jgi:RNA 3'-terminal phosphate cyclase-like protein